MNDQIKEFIDLELLREKTKTPHTSRYPLLKNKFSKQYEKIMMLTKFLSNNVTFSERLYVIMKDINKTPICLECNKPVKFKNYTKGYKTFCSHKCGKKSEVTKNKMKQNNLNKYGVENVFQADTVKNKIKHTNLKRYGYSNPNKSKEISQKVVETKLSKSKEEKESTLKRRKKTFTEKYGVDNIFKSETFLNDKLIIQKRKMKQKTTQKINYFNRVKKDVYNKDYHLKMCFTMDDYLEEKDLIFKCVKCNKKYNFESLIKNGEIHKCKNCYPPVLNYEQYKLFEFIKNKIPETEYNDRKLLKIKGERTCKELDILVASKKLAIEYDGILWHSFGKSKFLKFDNHELENRKIRYYVANAQRNLKN